MDCVSLSKLLRLFASQLVIYLAEAHSIITVAMTVCVVSPVGVRLIGME